MNPYAHLPPASSPVASTAQGRTGGLAGVASRRRAGAGIRWNSFYLIFAVVMITIVAVGFGPTLYLRPLLVPTDRFAESGLPAYLLLHGMALTAWYGLFLTQTLLVGVGRVSMHRRLGVAGIGVALVVLTTSLVTMQRLLDRVRGPEGVSERATNIVVSDLGVLVAFTLLVALAVHFRRRVVGHKRLMLLASVVLIGPAFSTGRPIGRAVVPLLPVGVRPSLLFMGLAILALVWHDVATRKRVEPVTAWGAAVIGIVIGASIAVINAGHAGAVTAWFDRLF